MLYFFSLFFIFSYAYLSASIRHPWVFLNNKMKNNCLKKIISISIDQHVGWERQIEHEVFFNNEQWKVCQYLSAKINNDDGVLK